MAPNLDLVRVGPRMVHCQLLITDSVLMRFGRRWEPSRASEEYRCEER
jgi:hypothetical protein